MIVPPPMVWATYDRKYQVLNLHASLAEAKAERRRDPSWIDLIEYERRSPQATDTKGDKSP
jgi:hypothetical protein